MKKLHEVVFYSGEEPFPTYYLIDTINCENIEEELRSKLARITQRVRRMLSIEDDISDWKIHEALYVLPEDGLIAVKSIA